MKIKQLTIEDFSFLPEDQRKKTLAFHKIQNIIKLFNEGWKPDFNNANQRKYYPYFVKNASGWVLFSSYYRSSYSFDEVGFYQDEDTSNHCARLFLPIYNEYLNEN